MMLRLLTWLTPREGWGAFVLVLITVLCLPTAAISAEWVPGDVGLLPVALVALLVGRWLAFREDWGWDIWLLTGASVGLLVALSAAAHVVFLPVSAEAGFDFAQRWTMWLQAAFSGGSSDDPDVFLFYAALLCWAAVLALAWGYYRRQRPLVALLPPAALSAVTVFYSGEGIWWLVLGLGCGVLVLAQGNLTRAQRAWDAARVDYAIDLHFDLMGSAAFIAVVVVLLSYFGPMLSVRRVSSWVRRAFKGPTAQVEETAERLFGGVSPPRGRPGAGDVPGAASSYLPQSRLLGGRPDSFDDVMMMVWTDEPPPPLEGFFPDDALRFEEAVPPHYWRGMTYDRYTGQGWVVTGDSREVLDGALPVPALPAYREVVQRVEFTAPHGDTLFAMNVPAWVDGSVEGVWYTVPGASSAGEPLLSDGKSGGDLAWLASDTMSYTVVSHLPKPSASALRSASPTYPAEIDERYLQLPNTAPQRVIDLAWEVVADGKTVYEQARLLERYLRLYPYSLEVHNPPAEVDVADWFLFEAREGYCDYYATAFVVMARAVGIPARLASGYVGGQYDPSSGAYLVRQKNSHSWPEVYFPDWGWIGFEPTGAQPASEFPDEVAINLDALPRPTGPPARIVRIRWRLAGLGLMAFAGIGLLAAWVGRQWRRQRVQVVTVPVAWSWVARAGARLGLPPDSALTPQEYAAALATDLGARARRTRRLQDHWQSLATEGSRALRLVAKLYSEQAYAGHLVTTVDEQVVQQMWTRLRRPLRWFAWLRWIQRAQ